MRRYLSRVEHKINSYISRAIKTYDLIKEGDHILVAVSGGKDSLALLYFLKKIQEWAPVHYTLSAVHVKSDFKCGGLMNAEALEKYFKELEVPYVFRQIQVTDAENKTNCFWCSWNRRKRLFETCKELGCNKLALGHHKDDIVETTLMNLIFNGHISTMNVCQELFKGTLHVIRPLCFVEERWTKQFAKERGWMNETCASTCSVGDVSRRKYIKNFITETEKITGHARIRTHIFNAIARVREEYIGLKKIKSVDEIMEEKDAAL